MMLHINKKDLLPSSDSTDAVRWPVNGFWEKGKFMLGSSPESLSIACSAFPCVTD